MALITFNGSRLIWPALAARHAGPWLRKISATSSFGPANAVYDVPFLRFAAVRSSNGLSPAEIMPVTMLAYLAVVVSLVCPSVNPGANWGHSPL